MRRLFIFSGAGLSAESGISTFRDVNGLWENHDVRDVCTYSTWEYNKELVFKFYNQRRMQLVDVKPNAAHHVISELSDLLGSDRFFHVTQNVDDLTERAGSDALHVHGDLTKLKCEDCDHIWDIGYNEVQPDVICPECGVYGETKPSVIFFGEAAQRYKRMWDIFSMPIKDDVILVIGTSGNVINIGSLINLDVPTKNILITPDSGMLNTKYFDTWYKGPVGEILPEIKNDLISYLKD